MVSRGPCRPELGPWSAGIKSKPFSATAAGRRLPGHPRGPGPRRAAGAPGRARSRSRGGAQGLAAEGTAGTAESFGCRLPWRPGSQARSSPGQGGPGPSRVEARGASLRAGQNEWWTPDRPRASTGASLSRPFRISGRWQRGTPCPSVLCCPGPDSPDASESFTNLPDRALRRAWGLDKRTAAAGRAGLPHALGCPPRTAGPLLAGGRSLGSCNWEGRPVTRKEARLPRGTHPRAEGSGIATPLNWEFCSVCATKGPQAFQRSVASAVRLWRNRISHTPPPSIFSALEASPTGSRLAGVTSPVHRLEEPSRATVLRAVEGRHLTLP